MPLPALAVGNRYRASVRARTPDGRIVIELGGMQLSARAEAELEQAAEVEVEVIRLLPEVVLKLRRQILPAR